MKTLIWIFPILLVTRIAFGQTASECYNNPIDTVLGSKALHANKAITIILPRSYSKANPAHYPLIIVFDRQNKNIFRETYESINYLVASAEMPESIIIGITDSNQHRYVETSLLSSNKQGKGEAVVDFLYQELIPWAETAFNCSKVRVFIGHSRFGYFTSYLLSKKIDDLTAVVSCSPFFLQSNVNLVDPLKHALETTTLQHTVYYRFITGDSIADSKDYALMQAYLASSKPITNFDWKGLAFYKAKHLAVPGLGVMPALLDIFYYWSDYSTKILSDTNNVFTRAIREQFSRDMALHYGDTVGLGLANLNGIGYKYYNQNNYTEARRAWDILAEDYPIFSEARITIADTYTKENSKSEARKNYEIAKQALNASPFYDAQEKADLLTEIEQKLHAMGK